MKIKNIPNSQPRFSTTSLDLSAFLLANGSELLEYKLLPEGRVAFYFPIQSQELVPLYFEGEAVSAIRFWGEIKRLKSVVHAG